MVKDKKEYIKQYSERLGPISDTQFQKALDVFDLGQFIKAEPISQGLFGQNVFVYSSKGQFVLRGKPHYDWQFKNERLFTDLLHEQTDVPVPFPYLLNPDTDIFGWEYVIMPRMRGQNLADNLSEEYLSDSDRIGIAVAQGNALREAQLLTHYECGRFDLQSNGFKPFVPDWETAFLKPIIVDLEKSAKYNANTPPQDISWIEKLINEAKTALVPFVPTFYMRDFKPGNMVVDIQNGKWKVTGLFDLMEASFGHPEADISRLYAVYVEYGRKDSAYAFLNSYLSIKEDLKKFVKRFPLFMLYDRVIVWEWVQRHNNAWWNKNWTFRQWVTPFLEIDINKLFPTN